ncbi:hypothetical protein KQI58_17435, partial [Enterococcus raffinosus]|uniref:hypothetical protein n=1 Tax=Enterococcus raffinosus TaxID=71452 RepID=UPI001C102F97
REQWVPLVDFDPRSEWAQSLFSPFGTPPVVDIVSLAVGEGENETPYYLTLTRKGLMAKKNGWFFNKNLIEEINEFINDDIEQEQLEKVGYSKER